MPLRCCVRCGAPGCGMQCLARRVHWQFVLQILCVFQCVLRNMVVSVAPARAGVVVVFVVVIVLIIVFLSSPGDNGVAFVVRVVRFWDRWYGK